MLRSAHFATRRLSGTRSSAPVVSSLPRSLSVSEKYTYNFNSSGVIVQSRALPICSAVVPPLGASRSFSLWSYFMDAVRGKPTAEENSSSAKDNSKESKSIDKDGHQQEVEVFTNSELLATLYDDKDSVRIIQQCEEMKAQNLRFDETFLVWAHAANGDRKLASERLPALEKRFAKLVENTSGIVGHEHALCRLIETYVLMNNMKMTSKHVMSVSKNWRMDESKFVNASIEIRRRNWHRSNNDLQNFLMKTYTSSEYLPGLQSLLKEVAHWKNPVDPYFFFNLVRFCTRNPEKFSLDFYWVKSLSDENSAVLQTACTNLMAHTLRYKKADLNQTWQRVADIVTFCVRYEVSARQFNHSQIIHAFVELGNDKEKLDYAFYVFRDLEAEDVDYRYLSFVPTFYLAKMYPKVLFIIESLAFHNGKDNATANSNSNFDGKPNTTSNEQEKSEFVIPRRHVVTTLISYLAMKNTCPRLGKLIVSSAEQYELDSYLDIVIQVCFRSRQIEKGLELISQANETGKKLNSRTIKLAERYKVQRRNDTRPSTSRSKDTTAKNSSKGTGAQRHLHRSSTRTPKGAKNQNQNQNQNQRQKTSNSKAKKSTA